VAASSTPAAFITALKTALAARFAAHGTLSAVRVDIIPTGDTSAIDAVTLLRGPVVGGQEYAAMANRRQDAYEIPGVIFTYATGSDSDAAFQESWDRAALILDELILMLRDNQQLAGDALQKNRVTEVQYEAQVRDQGGWVTRCEYTIEYAALVA
jgi:hypothetical protein